MKKMFTLLVLLLIVFSFGDAGFATGHIDEFVGQVQKRMQVYGDEDYSGKKFIISKEDRVIIKRYNRIGKAFIIGIVFVPVDHDKDNEICIIPIKKQEIKPSDFAIFIDFKYSTPIAYCHY